MGSAVPLGLVGRASCGWRCAVLIDEDGVVWVALWLGGRRVGTVVCRWDWWGERCVGSCGGESVVWVELCHWKCIA